MSGNLGFEGESATHSVLWIDRVRNVVGGRRVVVRENVNDRVYRDFLK